MQPFLLALYCPASVLNQSFLMRALFVFVVIALFISCQTSYGVLKNRFGDWNIVYTLYDGSHKLHIHKPFELTAIATIRNVHHKYCSYSFLQKDTLGFKTERVNKSTWSNYYLVFDSTFAYELSNMDKKVIHYAKGINGEIFPISPLDSVILQDVIRLGDSLHLKDLHYLNKAIGFRCFLKKGDK